MYLFILFNQYVHSLRLRVTMYHVPCNRCPFFFCDPFCFFETRMNGGIYMCNPYIYSSKPSRRLVAVMNTQRVRKCYLNSKFIYLFRFYIL